MKTVDQACASQGCCVIQLQNICYMKATCRDPSPHTINLFIKTTQLNLDPALVLLLVVWVFDLFLFFVFVFDWCFYSCLFALVFCLFSLMPKYSLVVTIMPKVKKVKKERKEKFVIAMDKTTCCYEKIILHKETRDKFSKAGAVQRRPPLVQAPPPSRAPLTPSEIQEFHSFHAQEHANAAILSHLVLERQELEKTTLDSFPLITSTISTPIPTLHIPLPLSKSIHFYKTSTLKRVNDTHHIIHATTTRLSPILTKLQMEETNARLGVSVKVPTHIRTALLNMITHLTELEENLLSETRTLTHSQWRQFTGAMKRIGEVQFDDLAKRFPEICSDLFDLKISLPGM